MAAAAERGELAGGSGVAERVEELGPHLPLARRIEAFWLEEDHRVPTTWTEHRDINEVMLATSLWPDGFLDLRPPGETATDGCTECRGRR